MKRLRTVVIILSLAVTNCRSTHEEQRSSDHRAHESSAAAQPNAVPEDTQLLRIAPEMIRDLRITTRPTELRPGGEGVAVLGELRVNQERYAEVGTPIDARVVAVVADSGAAVAASQPLAQLSATELGKARAEYLAAKAQARLAAQTLGRKRSLAAERIAAMRELQAAEAGAAASDANLQATRAALQSLGVAANEIDAVPADPTTLTLRAPISGVVIDRSIALGQFVEPSQTLFRIADLSALWLTVHAFERDAVRIQPGAAVRVTFPALPGRSFSASVALVGREVDSTSRTVPVRIVILNEQELLRPGMSATAWIKLGGDTEQIVAVPTAAVQRVEGGWSVFIPRGESAFEIRAVGRGRDLDGEVEIVSGLEPGETVVVEGAFLLKAETDKARGAGEHHDH